MSRSAQVVVLALATALLAIPLAAMTPCQRQDSHPPCRSHCPKPMAPTQGPVTGTAPCCQLSPGMPVAPVQSFVPSGSTAPAALPVEVSTVPVAPEPDARSSERAGPPRATGHSPQALNCVFLV